MQGFLVSLLMVLTSMGLASASQPPGATATSGANAGGRSPVSVVEEAGAYVLANGLLAARIEKRSGTLVSLQYRGLELLSQKQGGANGGYWSSVGRGRPGAKVNAVLRIDPSRNGGERAEVSCQFHNDPQAPDAPVDADYRYALGRGESWLYVYSVLEHKPGYPAFGVGEARYCLKLNPELFDYMTIDANRRRLMPSGYDWDHGAPLNLKEARRMTTGVHQGEAEHKYDYAAVLYETPAYGWSSTKAGVGLWLINPSMEYLGGGPTKAELTGHLDVNPGGLPTLLNMWVGSHYGGTSLGVSQTEAWTKVVGPFLLYCNAADQSSPAHGALWRDALAQAAHQAALWPFAWVTEPNYPPASARAVVSGQLTVHDPFASGLKATNLWVGVTAPDYLPAARPGFGFGRSYPTNAVPAPPASGTNAARGGFATGRGGFPPWIDWQRDAKHYQFWTRADAQGRFRIPHVRAGTYTLHAIADGVLGEFTLTNVVVGAGEGKELGALCWVPVRYGRTLWEIGLPDRTAREYRHGDRYWQWGLYFDYPKEFPKDVNFFIGQSDWRRDWNYVQPPRILGRAVAVRGEEDEAEESAALPRGPGRAEVRSSTWSIVFGLPEPVRGRAVLRLAFCGTHAGCNVEALVNGKTIGETGPLPSTSAMQRDGIQAYWIEKDLSFDAGLLTAGTNVVKLLSHAQTWSQGVMYDAVRLELREARSADYAVGADVSFLKQAEAMGTVFKDNGEAKPGLQILKEHGYNWVRLRLFHSPTRLPNNLEYTVASAKEARRLGYKFLLDFHYSDTWADPGKQFVPKAWAGMSHRELVEAVSAYTRDSIAAFREAGVLPDMVQIGNEIIHGLLWPDGKLPEQWEQLAELIQAGIRGVEAGRADQPRPRIMIHIDRGGDRKGTQWFFDKLNSYKVDYEVIGQSFYPWWHGSLGALRDNLAFMAERYQKDILLVEAAYNWRPTEFKSQPAPFPESPEGQRQFLEAVNQLVLATPHQRGKGVFWWEPVVMGGLRSRGMFDETGNALPVIRVFDEQGSATERAP